MIPPCEENPELWFPISYDFRLKHGPKREEAMDKILTAFKICSTCPLSLNGKCLDLAFTDISTIDYGIFGGTLPLERRIASGSFTTPWEGQIWQQDVRREATKAGIIPPHIGKRRRPVARHHLIEEEIKRMSKVDKTPPEDEEEGLIRWLHE